MDELLMLRGEERTCRDCATETIFLPVDNGVWVCTACDGALEIPGRAA